MAFEPGETLDWLELTDALLQALEHADIGMVITLDDSPSPRYLHYNDAAARILEVDTNELRQLRPMSFLCPDELPRFEEIFARRRQGDDSGIHDETWIITATGRRVPIELGIARASYRGAPASVSFIKDISDRVATQERLRKSEARFRQLAEASPDSITVMSGGRFVYANPAAITLMGFDSMEDFIARPIEQLLPPEELETMKSRIQRVRSGERLTPLEYHGYRKDGTLRTMEISSIATEFEGQPAVLGYGRDVTERNRIQAELVQAERMAAIGPLAAGVAHEINNPLTYVLLRLQGLQRGLRSLIPDPDARARTSSQIDEVIEGSQRVADIVRNLLSFARTEGDEPEISDVETIIDSAAKLAGTTLRNRASLERDFGDVGMVAGSRSRLGQVFLNLIVNAAQSFECESPDHNRIVVSTRLTDDGVRVEVADNGSGIPFEHRDRIFEPFFTTKDGQGGTGLGLAITQSTVDRLGGTIEVADGIDGGTSFVVTLPAVGHTTPPEERAPAPWTKAARSADILIIDDEAPICTALAHMLDEEHRVTTETDSLRGLELLENGNHYDVVLCDLSMPELMGQDLYARICEQRPEYRYRFVFITGGATHGRAAKFIESTDALVLHKPLSPDVIARVIQRVMKP